MNLTPLLTALSQHMSTLYTTVKTKIETLYQRVNAHITDTGNPHNLTRKDIGLGLVENYPPATKVQAENGISSDTVMTPKRVDEYMEKNVYTPLTEVFDAATQNLQP